MFSALNNSYPHTLYRKQKLHSRDQGSAIERRVKVLTDGKDDTADPCTPVEVKLPNGQTMYALYCSGGRVLYYSSLADLLHGGIKAFHKIKVLTKDGDPLVMEPFHQAEAIWDTELVVYSKKNSDGSHSLRNVGHGGMMERVEPKIPCNVVNHNYRRSRHAFNIEFVVDEKTNEIHETWQDTGAVHGNRPPVDGRWISEDQDQLHAHGYGSRMIRDEQGFPWRDAEGFMWMVYEEVTEEKLFAPGYRLPTGTKIFARRMNEDLTQAVGKPVLLSSYTPWENLEKPFLASRRWDQTGQPAGHLVEGPNPILMKIDDKEYWVIFFSAGDYVREYGNYMMYREKAEGPIGPYRHVVDEKGELINLTQSLAEELELTWSGRLNPFYDNEGNLWGVMHGIFKDDIPDGWTKSGWPRTSEEFICYARRVFLVPLAAKINAHQPSVMVAEE